MPRVALWLLANLLPFPLLLAVGHSGWRVAPGVVIALLVFGVALGQARAMKSRRWFAHTIIGLAAALATAAVVLGAADAFGAERAGIAVSHILGGTVLVLVQATALDRAKRRQWITLGVAAWVIFPIALVLSRWHPAGNSSPFAGYRELASFTLLLAGYGIATPPRSDAGPSARRGGN